MYNEAKIEIGVWGPQIHDDSFSLFILNRLGARVNLYIVLKRTVLNTTAQVWKCECTRSRYFGKFTYSQLARVAFMAPC